MHDHATDTVMGRPLSGLEGQPLGPVIWGNGAGYRPAAPRQSHGTSPRPGDVSRISVLS